MKTLSAWLIGSIIFLVLSILSLIWGDEDSAIYFMIMAWLALALNKLDRIEEKLK